MAREGLQVVGGLVRVINMGTHEQDGPAELPGDITDQHRSERSPRPLDVDDPAAGGALKPSDDLLNRLVPPEVHTRIVRQSQPTNNPALARTDEVRH